jgi:hypothetical protein
MPGMGADDAPGWLGCLPSITWELWHLGCGARSRDPGHVAWAETMGEDRGELGTSPRPATTPTPPQVVPTSCLITPQSKGGGRGLNLAFPAAPSSQEKPESFAS